MLAETKTGVVQQSDGTPGVLRGLRQGGAATGDAQGRYYENTFRGQVFSLALTAWTTGVAVGNLVGATAAVSTNFILWNPTGSGKNISLLKFGVGVNGTLLTDALYHGYMTTIPTNATTVVTPIACNNLGLAPASIARALTSAAGTALTGNSAPAVLRMADIALVGASTTVVAKAIEYIDGEIVLPPGTAWLPLWGVAAAAMPGNYSITWEEIPL